MNTIWAAVADGWREHADYVDSRGAEVTRRMLELCDPQPGERVLELACGPGGVGLAAAALVGPAGEVVLSDGVEEMTEIAAARAAAYGLGNVTTRVLELERIDEPDGAYDVVLCREGLMFAPRPDLAAREILRVLRPGGRVALAVWGARERNPWLGLVLDAASAQLGMPFPAPGVAGPFALADAAGLGTLLSDAGLREVVVSELDVAVRAASFEEWWTRTCALAGPLAKILAALPDEAMAELRERAGASVAGYATCDGLEIPGVTLLAAGRA